MAPQELQSALNKRPFEPFRLIQTDGASYDVRHPDMLLVGLRAAVVGWHADPEQHLFDRMATLDLRHLIRIEPLAQSLKSGDGKDK